MSAKQTINDKLQGSVAISARAALWIWFTKRLKRFGHMSYAIRLDRLKAETLELRRLKSHLTMMFSITRGFVGMDCNCIFNVIDCESIHTRGRNI